MEPFLAPLPLPEPEHEYLPARTGLPIMEQESQPEKMMETLPAPLPLPEPEYEHLPARTGLPIMVPTPRARNSATFLLAFWDLPLSPLTSASDRSFFRRTHQAIARRCHCHLSPRLCRLVTTVVLEALFGLEPELAN